jgi:hypothetical protein
MKKSVFAMVVALIISAMALVAFAGDRDCGVGTSTENLQQIQVGAISLNLNMASSNGGAGSVAGSSSFQNSMATGMIIYDPVIQVQTSTVGGSVSGSRGDAKSVGVNSGSATASGIIRSYSITRYGR